MVGLCVLSSNLVLSSLKPLSSASCALARRHHVPNCVARGQEALPRLLVAALGRFRVQEVWSDAIDCLRATQVTDEAMAALAQGCPDLEVLDVQG